MSRNRAAKVEASASKRLKIQAIFLPYDVRISLRFA